MSDIDTKASVEVVNTPQDDKVAAPLKDKEEEDKKDDEEDDKEDNEEEDDENKDEEPIKKVKTEEIKVKEEIKVTTLMEYEIIDSVQHVRYGLFDVWNIMMQHKLHDKWTVVCGVCNNTIYNQDGAINTFNIGTKHICRCQENAIRLGYQLAITQHENRRKRRSPRA